MHKTNKIYKYLIRVLQIGDKYSELANYVFVPLAVETAGCSDETPCGDS